MITNDKFGGAIYIYKRPNLREFLTKLTKFGHIAVFTQNQQSYADPIIDKLDPDRKLFKHRFYG